jgi:outer membrane protein W
MHGVDDLRAMAAANRTHISSVLGQAGIGDISTQMLNVLATGYISETTVAPGTRFEWMALKRSGRPSVLRSVRWTGRQSFDAFQFSVESAGYTYTFVVPKVCGNFALLSRTATPVAAVEPPRAAPAPEPLPPPPPPRPAPVAAAPPPAPPIAVKEERPPRWTATGFIGSAFATGGDLPINTTTNDGNITFGGQIDYAWRNVLGAEFLADFAPKVKMDNLFLSENPTINSYMLNVIGKAPLGDESRFQPYVSGGIGVISMRTQTFTLNGIPLLAVNGTIQPLNLDSVNNNQSKFGADIGFGIFVFARKWGVRADVRYYDAARFDSEKLTNNVNDFTQALESGLTYWRANLGLAFRW